jgi:hypothetical protein
MKKESEHVVDKINKAFLARNEMDFDRKEIVKIGEITKEFSGSKSGLDFAKKKIGEKLTNEIIEIIKDSSKLDDEKLDSIVGKLSNVADSFLRSIRYFRPMPRHGLRLKKEQSFNEVAGALTMLRSHLEAEVDKEED